MMLIVRDGAVALKWLARMVLSVGLFIEKVGEAGEVGVVKYMVNVPALSMHLRLI